MDVGELVHEKPEFMLAALLSAMNKLGVTHIRLTTADVKAAVDSCMFRMRSPTPDQLDIYVLTQPGEQHVGLDLAEPYIPPDVTH